MFTWMQYQEDVLFDELEGSFADKLEKFESFTTEITGKKYQAISTEEMIAQQKQLTLGCYTGDKVHLELIDNFTLSWKKAYSSSIYQRKSIQG